MLIAIFGESCTGKSTLAEELAARLGAAVYTGRDYLRLEKSPAAAEESFRRLLRGAVAGGSLICVISEREQLALLPEGAVRVLVTAPLDTIKERFAARMGGSLPPPVEAMLEKRHGCFDAEARDVHIVSGERSAAEACAMVEAVLKQAAP